MKLRYADAIGLCTLCPNECFMPENELQDLHLKYGLQLFQEGSFEKATINFLLSKVEAKNVIGLFPEDLLPRGTKITRRSEFYSASALKSEQLVSALNSLVNYLEKTRANIMNIGKT